MPDRCLAKSAMPRNANDNRLLQFQASTRAPTDDRGFDWAAGLDTAPSVAAPAAQKWNDISADVIFAKKFKRLVRRGNTFMSEGVDSLLPCRHAVLIIPIVTSSMRT